MTNTMTGIEFELPFSNEPEHRAALEAMYGAGFPLANESADDDDWVRWADQLWQKHESGVRSRLHLVERNRLIRKGIQWISATGFGPWREPPKPKDTARAVFNVIGPALDQRCQIIAENRPGFRVRPENMSSERRKRAEAVQAALEYQYDQQNMESIRAEMAYWAGTDGICFAELYWDPDRGPWHEFDIGRRMKLGDIRCCVRRVEQVRVSPNATMSDPPWYWVIRESIPLGEAVLMYGDEVADSPSETQREVHQRSYARLGMLEPGDEELYKDQTLVNRTTVYCEPSDALPRGLTLIVVGKKVIFLGPLLIGVVPVFWMRDGSTDPAFFPRPIMEGWIDQQMRINSLLSRWIESIRRNAGSRLLAKQHAIVPETLTGGTLDVIEVRGLGELSQLVRVVDGFSLAPDAKELMDREIRAFEMLSGWNDASRGSFASDMSGRAILAIREQLERIFAPPVRAAADAMVQWAKITCAWMSWGYDIPRTLAVVGEDRPDLAIAVSADDFDGVTDITIDPETLMPMPRALRLFLLQSMYREGVISLPEYRRRLPFAYLRQINSPDEDHSARALRIVEAIKQTGMPVPPDFPILWMDNEAIHQDVLEREIILRDDLPMPIRQAAYQRWMMLAQQAMTKQPQVPMPMPQPQRKSQPTPISPKERPLLGTNPSVATSTVANLTRPDDMKAARQFDQLPT